LHPFLRLVRFAKVASLVANAWTIFYAVLIVGWQITSLLREGSWPALPLSSVINKLGYERGAIYATASAHEIESSVVDALLRVPAIVPLLLASALLTAFYLWLASTEKTYSGN
jgi:hypothetical protein